MNTSPDITAETARSGPTSVLPERRPAGWAWVLPQDAECARHARAVLTEALSGLGVGRDLIADAQLMVSELATNAYQHAGEFGPHEVWLDPPESGRPEVRCAVFDGQANTRLPGYSWTSGDYGRGLNIVNELSGGCWGLRAERSRLNPQVQGKAVWFAIQLSSA